MLMNSAQVEFKEEEKVHQLIENMDIGNLDSLPSNIGLEEANSQHVFHYFLCLVKRLEY
jgi:hypothetical protein